MEETILVVDDDPTFVRLVDKALSREGYKVLTAGDGQEALRHLFAHRPDLVLLDVIMPRMDGWQTCRRIREASDTPLFMLTGQQRSEEDTVRAFGWGVDEFLNKPLGNRELLARVRAMLRRSGPPSPPESEKRITYNDDYLAVDIAKRRVVARGERVRLTPTEFHLFALLLENSGRVLTHKQLLAKVWGWEYIDDRDHSRVYVWRLRQKIEPDPSQPKYIMAEPGVGYYFQRAT